VTLLEKEDTLGGLGRRLHHTIEGDDVQAFVKELVESVETHEHIEVLKQALVVELAGIKAILKPRSWWDRP
jgi:heterodisulfide reductase subunit A-like polyferredoxin